MSHEQVISDEGKFRNDIKNYLQSFKEMGSDYVVLGIIGAQSSGKSTLLNNVFGSKFVTMQENIQRKQTTKGIWMQASPEYKTLIFDIEGADSRERWEQKSKYEKSTALFGLVVSNVLLVNIWLQEIGRFSACNYETLKLIFELNLRFFKSEQPKKIMFVIRDFRDDENLAGIEQVLNDDVKKMWLEIKKPEEHKDLAFTDVFKIEIFTMSHFIFKHDNFLSDVKSLRRKLTDKNDSSYILKGVDLRNVPIDSLFAYMKNIWTIIEENKDIDIPNQKLMVANYRCQEIKQDLLSQSTR